MPAARRDPCSSIAVILTCHNRRAKTLACVEAVLAQAGLDNVALDFFITDDASADGTGAALLGRHGAVKLLQGSGSLFWNGGMRLAWATAFAGRHDFFLWLNDDTFLDPDTLRRMLDTHAAAHLAGAAPGIVIGSTRNSAGDTSYGGERQRSLLRPLTLDLIAPLELAQPCDTFNGNCVMIARPAADLLGNLDPGFIHAMGDTDYGLRAKKAGVPMWVMPGYAGYCVDESKLAGGFQDRALPLALRWEKIRQPKGLPWRPWLLLCRRHAGPLWPLYWIWPYLKLVVPAWRPTTRKPVE